MPHIELPNEPGILALLAYKTSTATVLRMLADALLRGHSPLSPGERELIAAYVSLRNDCAFCYMSHAHTAAVLLDTTVEHICEIAEDPEASKISLKMKALLQLAKIIQLEVREVDHAIISLARTAGATDEEIHDTVLIAAAFCMYNRYVDGLGTDLPKTDDEFAQMGKHLAANGYVR